MNLRFKRNREKGGKFREYNSCTQTQNQTNALLLTSYNNGKKERRTGKEEIPSRL